MMETSIDAIVSQDYLSAGTQDTKASVLPRMIAQGVSEGYVLDSGRFCGKFTLQALIPLEDNQSIMDAVDADPVFIKHDASILQAIEIASDFVGESIPIIDQDQHEMQGVVTEGDIFSLYLKTQSTIMDLEHS